jgi:hypothetical protein
MAPLVTHLVVGQRVFFRLERFEPSAYGAFLLGCLLADAEHSGDPGRRTAHFVDGLTGNGNGKSGRSSVDFVREMDSLLVRPWHALAHDEQAFVAGYVCHLATDEEWKRYGWDMLEALGIRSAEELPVAGGVVMTAFDVLSSQLVSDEPPLAPTLGNATIPDVMARIPHAALRATWVAVKAHVLNGRTSRSYFDMLRHLGRSDEEVAVEERAHDLRWRDAVALVEGFGGVTPPVKAAVRRSMETVPRLWD